MNIELISLMSVVIGRRTNCHACFVNELKSPRKNVDRDMKKGVFHTNGKTIFEHPNDPFLPLL